MQALIRIYPPGLYNAFSLFNCKALNYDQVVNSISNLTPLMKEQKSTKQYFAVVKFEVTPTATAKLNMLPFHFSQAGITTKCLELEGISAQVLKALDVLTVQTPTAAVKELLIIIHHYDGKNQINWSNTLNILERRLLHLNYRESFIADFMKQLLLSFAPNHLLSIN